MKLLLVPALFIAAIAVGPVSAQQQGNPAGMMPGTPQSGIPAPNLSNVPDRNFARAATAGGLSEVEIGRVAEHEGESPAVREFGQRMVNDHSQANTELAKLAAVANIPLPNSPDSEHRRMGEELSTVHGAAFDRSYIAGQIIDHQQTAQLFEYEANTGQDEQLKDFASRLLPDLMQHLAMAQDINARLTGAAEPESAMSPAAGAQPPHPGGATDGEGAGR